MFPKCVLLSYRQDHYPTVRLSKHWINLVLDRNPRGDRNNKTNLYVYIKESSNISVISAASGYNAILLFFPPLALPFYRWTQAGCVTDQALSKHSQMNSTTTNFNTSWTKSPLGFGLVLVMHFMAPSGWVGAMYVCEWVYVCVHVSRHLCVRRGGLSYQHWCLRQW